jgi:adenylate kinase
LIEVEAPIKEETCDDCSIALTRREDDNEETFNLRYETYMKETQPLIDFYKEKGLLITIDASKTPELVFEDIKKVLDGVK